MCRQRTAAHGIAINHSVNILVYRIQLCYQACVASALHSLHWHIYCAVVRLSFIRINCLLSLFGIKKITNIFISHRFSTEIHIVPPTHHTTPHTTLHTTPHSTHTHQPTHHTTSTCAPHHAHHTAWHSPF